MKIFIGSLVGAIIIFVWQFLSWTVLDLHRPAQQYTPKQDDVLAYLSTQFDSSGGYIMPGLPENATMDQQTELGEKSLNKPWAQIFYHKSYNTSMGLSMVKNLITNFLMALFFCWIIAGYTANNFVKTFLAAIFVAFIVFLHSAYTMNIWYQTFDLGAYLADYLVGWGLTGIWLGWWLNREKK